MYTALGMHFASMYIWSTYLIIQPALGGWLENPPQIDERKKD